MKNGLVKVGLALFVTVSLCSCGKGTNSDSSGDSSSSSNSSSSSGSSASSSSSSSSSTNSSSSSSSSTTPVTYTCRFYNDDKTTLLWSATIEAGKDIEYKGGTPSKAKTAQYTYTFSGWDKSLKGIKSNTNFYATYTSTVNTYRVEFINYDDTVIVSSEVEYDTYASAPTTDPIRAKTDEYTYTFKGWDKDPSTTKIVGPTTFKAQYDESKNTYLVSFVVEGVTTHTVAVAYGEYASYSNEWDTPTKSNDNDYVYSFNGWDKPLATTAIVKDTTFTAVLSKVTNSFKVTFKDGDGNEVQSSSYKYGETPTYTGDEPTKTKDDQYTYAFADAWEPAISEVTSDATYTAKFTTVTNSYLVSFYDEDGTTLLYSKEFPYGTVPTYGGTKPSKASSNGKTYAFKDWDKDLVAVTGTASYKATYTATNIDYTIIFKNGDTVLETLSTCHYGDTPSYTGETPTKKADAQYTYKFSGWSPEVVKVVGDATYVAQFSTTTNTYEVTFKNGDTVLQTSTLEYGATPVYTKDAPTKTATQEFHYTFDGWDKEIASVTGETTYTAKFKAEKNQYAITFKNADGTTLDTQQVDYGTTPTYTKANPTKANDTSYAYTFDKWDTDLAPVTGDATYTATFSKSSISLTYRYSSAKKAYTVTGCGDTTLKDLIVPKFYDDGINGKHDVTAISESAFTTLTSLTSITIPFIGTSLVFDETKPNVFGLIFSSSLNNDVPTSLTSVTVTGGETIPGQAFDGCTKLTSIVLPKGITSITYSAFYDCSSLTSIIIPDGVTGIEDQAFYGCSSLTSITIPESVTSFEAQAFYDCSSLTSITLPTSLTYVSTEVFADCSSLVTNDSNDGHYLGTKDNQYFFLLSLTDKITSFTLNAETKLIASDCLECASALETISVATDNTVYSSYDGMLFNKAQDTLLVCPQGRSKDVSLPNTTTILSDSCFSGCENLTSITLPESLLTINSGAFSYCASLTSIVIPASVTHININDLPDLSSGLPFMGTEMVFEGCDVLTTITVDENNKNYSSKDGILYNKDQTTLLLCPCGKTGTIDFAKGVQIIGNDAFYNCSNFTTITLPNTVTTISPNAFEECDGLTSMVFSNYVTSIGQGALYDCHHIASLTIPYLEFTNYEGKKSYVLKALFGDPDYGSIPSSLVSLTVSGGDSIVKNALDGCTNLTSLSLPFVGASATDTSNCLGYVFGGTKNSVLPPCLTMVAITNQAVISNGTFNDAVYLKYIILSSKTTSVYSNAFNGCGGLVKNEFNGCNYIGSTENGYLILLTATSTTMTTYTLNDSTMVVADGAFISCSSLAAITVNAANAFFSSLDGVLFNKTADTLVYCPLGKTGSFVTPDTVIYLTKNAFADCTLTELTIPFLGPDVDSDEATSYLFGSCLPDSLTTLTLTKAKTLATRAFNYCQKLVTLNLPETLTTINDYVFTQCSALTNLSIPNSLTYLGDVPFIGNTKLIYYTDGNGVNYLGNASNHYLVACCPVDNSTTSITINSATKFIASSCFSNSKATTLVVPDSVVFVAGSTSLPSGSSVNYNVYGNGNYFGNDTNPYLILVSVIDDTYDSFVINESTRVIYASAFYGCDKITSLSIPKNVCQILDSSIGECAGLTTISVAEENPTYSSVDGIMYDKAQTELLLCPMARTAEVTKIPDTVTSIGEFAFSSCQFSTIVLPDGLTEIPSYTFSGCEQLTSVTLPKSITRIGMQAFFGCIALETLNIPSGVTELGDYFVSLCVALKSFTVDEDNQTYCAIDGVLYSKDKKTLICCPTDKTGNLVVDANTQIIGTQAFYYCTNLTSITLPEGLTKIGRAAFNACIRLNNLIIPSTVTYIDDYAFEGCSGLGSITLPEGLTHIGSYVFSGCTGFYYLTIPSSVTYVGNYAFYKCNSSLTINCRGSSSSGWNANWNKDGLTVNYNYKS